MTKHLKLKMIFNMDNEFLPSSCRMEHLAQILKNKGDFVEKQFF